MIEATTYRRILGRFATGVALVTATVDGEPVGLVANSLASVSLVPPLLCFCPSRGSRTWKRMRSGGRFGVNVLGEHHEAFVRGAAPPGADRFAGVRHRPGAGGSPMLDDAVAFLECIIEAEHVAGDHWIVVGRVEAVASPAGTPPLVFWAGGFGTLRSTSGGPDGGLPAAAGSRRLRYNPRAGLPAQAGSAVP